MSNLLRRLRKLEARLTDKSGFPPHSKEWLRYWNDQLDIFLTRGDASAINGMTLEVVDAIIAADEEGSDVEDSNLNNFADLRRFTNTSP